MARSRATSLLVLGLTVAALSPARGEGPDPSAIEFFEKEVRPILVNRCQSCHGPTKQKGKLRLDARSSIVAGGRTGPAVVPGNPEESLLVEAINYGEFYQMPPKSKLPAREIATLTKWVAIGAPWPAEPAARPTTAATVKPFDLKERAKHWSFQPVRVQEPPAVKRADWPRNVVDRYILAALEAQGLAPAPEADRRTLIRRLTFDLTGLPPTPEEVDAFLADHSPRAYESLVERLLNSPHYGERWGRHWLDLVRFAETAGHEYDFEIPGTYRYRDYVIRAFNADVPYNQLIVEHVAGDLLNPPRRNPAEGFNESVLGTGFFFLGEGTHSPVDVREDEVARLDNQIDVLSKTFLGLTISCARCHDHKFDAIATNDYYALVGYLRSSRHQHAFIDPPERISAKAAELRELQEQIKSLLAAEAKPAPKPTARASSPADKSILFEDFNGPTFDGWFVTGDAWGDRPTREGDLQLKLDGPSPSAIRLAPGLAHSGSVSNRLQGALRSRTFTIEKKFIHYLVAGERSRINLVVDNFEKIRGPIYDGLTIAVKTGDQPHWITQNVGMWIGQKAYIELADGGAADYSQSKTQYVDGHGYLAIDEIQFSDNGPPPGPLPAFALDTIALGPFLSKREPASAAAILSRYREIESKLPDPTLGLAIADGNGEDEHVLNRGSHKTPGPVVPRRFLSALGDSDSPSPTSGSGRMELARRIADPANPFTARVMVNRLWKHHFGEGIVRSTDDFGAMGQPPSHPALLDALAARFIADGWSIKQMHRLMVESSTYRMSSKPAMGSEAERLDPTNRLLHRMNVNRLEAETIRDALLTVSGRLDPTLYGPPVLPFLTSFMDGRGRPASGPLDGNGRRSIYINVRRNFLTPMFLAFDYPTPFSTMGRRNVSNVPAQALTLLNDPFVLGQARLWSERLLHEGDRPASDRLMRLYLTAFGRPPTGQEQADDLAFLADQARIYGRPDDPRAWADLCHVLINVKEFIYIN